MKKSVAFFALYFSLFCSFNWLAAQTQMHWDTHGVGFSVPNDFKIDINNGDEFTAGNDHLLLSIMPIQDETVTEDNLADAVVEMATAMDYDVVNEADAIDIDDFTGYYVKGSLDEAHVVVMALLDKKSSTNLLVVIAYDNGYENAAVKVARSFYAYD
ncbi:MAG: hypothetical protein H6577_18220 [Lewinellaceae bacterium]|nr:hypothetical protein [Saprospiraceae bacterium]MCB9340062.1 hypothetical protein [Lewinellaceae bacterium]